MQIAIVDYGVGNLFSLRSSLRSLGYEAVVTGRAADLAAAPRILLPGVGAFGDAMDKLRGTGLDQAVLAEAARGKPLLGICLGMQLLFEKSFEFGEHTGLGLVPGQVVSLEAGLRAAGFAYKVPHIGWNPLHLEQPGSPLLKNTREGDYFYYVHSFYATGCGESLIASSEYGVPVAGAVQNGNVFGTQFHPEKSGRAGLAMLRAFAEIKA